MAKNVKINGVTYDNVPEVNIPLAAGSGNAVFYDTADDDAVAANIMSGKKAHGAAGEITGSMPDNGAVSEEISTKDGTYKPALGYHNGNGTVGIAAAEKEKLVSDNIRKGVTVLGVPGSPSVVDTKDADAAAANILKDKTAYVNGAKLTGTMTAATVSQDSSTKVLSIS